MAWQDEEDGAATQQDRRTAARHRMAVAAAATPQLGLEIAGNVCKGLAVVVVVFRLHSTSASYATRIYGRDSFRHKYDAS